MRARSVRAGDTRDGQQHEPQTRQPGQGWSEIVKTLQKIKDDLTKEEDKASPPDRRRRRAGDSTRQRPRDANYNRFKHREDPA